MNFAALLIAACGWLLMAAPLAAQKLEGYKHSGWTADDGAPPGIRSLAQSSDGFIWMASSDGVYRFDGVSFEKMPTLSDPELGEYQPLIVHASPNGDVWIGYRAGAVGLYRKGRLYDLHMPKPPEFVTTITEDGTGGMWVVSGGEARSLSRYKDGKWMDVREPNGLKGQIAMLSVDRQGIAWLAQNNRILYRARGGQRFVMTPAVVAAGSVRMGQGPDGRRWLIDAFGLRPLPDYPHGATDPAKPANTARIGKSSQFRFDRRGNFWGSDPALGIYMIPAAKLSDPVARAHPALFAAADGLTSDSAVSILVDREDNVWVGTSGGLDRLRKAAVRLQDGLGPISAAYAGETDGSGTTYIEDDMGIHAIGADGKVKLISHWAGLISSPCRLVDGSVVTLVPDTLLQLHSNGVKRLGPGPKDVPGGCAGDARGRLWIDGKNGAWRDQAGWHEVPRSANTPASGGIGATPWGVALLRLGATALMRLDPQRPAAMPASAFHVGAFFSVNRGLQDVLISGSRGLARVRGNAVRTIDGSRFPWGAKLRALAQTRAGDTWMQSPLGIVRVRTGDLDRAFENPLARLPYDLLDSADGLVSKGQKNGLWGSQILDGGDGIVRFLTGSGVVAIDPKDITHNALPPPVVISSLTSGGTKFFDPAAVDIAAGRAPITIAYSALSLSIPERVRVRYKLEGYDDDWIDPGRRREAVYGNLAPGTYRFTVIAANNDGVWNRKGATMLITVAPAFYQTLWFTLLCILLGALGLWWLYTLRVRQLTSRMQATMGVRLGERERIARELHDTLLQTFQGLVLQFQAAANRLAPGGPAAGALDRALQSADAALIEGRNRVRELRVEDADKDLTKNWIALAAELGTSHPARFELTVEGKPRALHPLVQEELKRLGEEALRNAYEHASASVIEVIVSYRAKRLSVDIRDNGIGLPSDVVLTGSREGHYGLVGMRERARRIGGTLSVASRKGAGTEVLVSVPATAAYPHHRRRWSLPFWR